ncbi:DUF397 domain-containing protein [Streptomyces sp. CA-181903]|uniref:DUF397 domain-containing protein n=1 Tax=Streptomyces sp. CA-181903 TaxID=3240055 RepID=UPI003D9419D3
MPEPIWFKSSFSDAGGNNCIEVRVNTPDIAIRESTDLELVIRTSPSAFHSLIRAIRAGVPIAASVHAVCLPVHILRRRVAYASRDREETALPSAASRRLVRSIAREL